MADRDDQNEKHIVMDCVQDAIVAYANAKLRSSAESPRYGWPRILAEERNCSPNSRLDCGIQFRQRSPGCWPQFDSIAAHVHPKSALTSSQGIDGSFSAIAASIAATSSASSRAVINSS
jgi:hypothetical protein